MGRRLEVELTSKNGDSWTWRKAGAKQPKGEVAAAILYQDAKVGDVVKVEADFSVDGIHITEVHAPQDKKGRSDLLEMKTRSWSKDELVTTKLAKKKGGRGKGRSGRRGDDRKSGPRPEAKPRAPRLKAKKTNITAAMSQMPAEYRPILERLATDGIPGVRKAVKEQNAKSESKLEEAAVMKIAEDALPKIRLADWQDRAEAASEMWEKVDLRDLRSVVVTGADVAKSDDDKKLQTDLSSKLEQRIESDHAEWISDLDKAIKEERLVAALKISSRPVKAGTPLSQEMATGLAELASRGLDAEATSHRWIVVLDSLAFSPVRAGVTPLGKPAEPSEELISELRRLSDRLPDIAKMFGIDPATVPASEKKKKSLLAIQRQERRKKQTDSKRKGRSKPEGKAVEAKEEPKKPSRPHPGTVIPEEPAEEPTAETTEEPTAESTEEPTASEAPEAEADTPAEETTE